MAETKVKKTVGKPKKTTNKPKLKKVKEEMITNEDIQNALKEILAEKMIGVKEFDPSLVEETSNEVVKIEENVFSIFDTMIDVRPPLYLQPIMNVLTRMYETSEDNYKNVKYNETNKTLQINLDAKQYPDVDKEISRIKYQLCYDTLKYEGHKLDGESPRILIVISEK